MNENNNELLTPLDDNAPRKGVYFSERDYSKKKRVGNIFIRIPQGRPKMPMCESCALYYIKLHANGLRDSSAVPACDGDRGERFGELTAADFESEKEYEDLLVATNPVLWAFKEFGFVARWYQEYTLLCSAKKVVHRWGRRAGKSTAQIISILWHIYHNPGFRVLIVSPFKDQIDLIFREMDKFIEMSPNLKKPFLVTDKDHPKTRSFANGSIVLGFILSPSVPQSADKIRGQEAEFLYIDEAAFINPAHYEVIEPIFDLNPNCKVVATSTPSLNMTKWNNWIFNKNLDFKEFWFIAAENKDRFPESKMKQVALNKGQATYAREYDAEIDTGTATYFLKSVVDATLEMYDMDKIKPTIHGVKIIGVDWNQNSGCHIVIVGMEKGIDKQVFKLLKKIIINPEDYKQHTAVEKIIELNNLWNPNYIVVDEGFGNLQIEMLRLHGKAYPSTGLFEKVMPMNMSSKLEIFDPSTGQYVKKWSKVFMFENLAHIMEIKRIILPVSEDTKAVKNKDDQTGSEYGLVQQIRETTRKESYSRPIFEAPYDHTLTAFGLAILGMTLKYSQFKDPTITEGQSTVIKPAKENQVKYGGFTPISRQLPDGNVYTRDEIVDDPDVKGARGIPISVPSLKKTQRSSQTRTSSFKRDTF